MANVPYSGDGPTVAPETRAPDDLQRVDANPDQFGAAIGRGTQQLGQGVEQAQKFSGQVRADDAYNTFAAEQNRILYGDPNKTVTNPDGTTAPDTGYYGLKGDAAVRARQGVEQQLDSAIATARKGLSSPESQLQFDSTTRRLRTAEGERIGQHAAQQEVTYQQGVHQASADINLNGIAVNPFDDDSIAHHTADLINARVNAVRLAGGGADQQTAAIQDARRDAVRAQVEAVAATDPSKATIILNAKKADAGAYYAPLLEKLHARTTAEDGQNLFKTALAGGNAPAGAKPTAPAANGLPQDGPMPPSRGDGSSPSPAGAAPPAAAPAASDLVHLPQFEAANKVLANRAASAADKAAAQKVLDRWNSQSFPQPGLATTSAPVDRPQGAAPMPDISGSDAPIPTLVRNPATGRMDTGGAPEIDRTKPAPQQGRDISPTPPAHPAAQAIPATVRNMPPDGSHSLPPATPGGAALPYFSQAGAAYGISGTYLTRTAQIESGLNPNAHNASGAAGVFQFVPSTWARYGNGGSPYDFGASTAAAVRLAADNKASLTRSLGRAPTDAELYLAHQQGAGGAAKLLANPNARAGDLLGDSAVRSNGGDPNASASAFTAMWTNKFNGTKGAGAPLPMFAAGFGGQGAYMGGPPPAGALPPILSDTLAPQPPASASTPEVPAPSLLQQAGAAPQAPTPPQVADQPQFRDPKAEVYDRILNSGQSPEVIQHAIQAANQHFQMQQVADEQDQRAKKVRSDQAYGRYTQAVLQGNISPQIMQQVAADPNLQPETKWTLTRAIREESARQGGGDKDAKNYGPGFFDGLKGITAPEGDPGRITSDTEILRRAGPGGDLTFEGAEKLISAKHASEHSVNDAAVNRTKTALIDYAKSQLSFDQEGAGPGFAGLKDPKGAALFNAQFIPQFESAYDAHIKAGKDPSEFLNQKRVDEIIRGLRNPRQMAADKLAALGGEPAPLPSIDAAAGGGGSAPPSPPPVAAPATPREPPPPSPDGYNAPGWSRLMQQAPVGANGAPMPMDAWSKAVRILADDPSPARVAQWNGSKFGRAGYAAADVLRNVRPGAAPPPSQPAMDLDLSQMGP